MVHFSSDSDTTFALHTITLHIKNDTAMQLKRGSVVDFDEPSIPSERH